MKKISKILLAVLLLMSTAVFTYGEDNTRQTLTVDETEVAKTVTEIRFDGNNAILQFSDSSTMTVDMQQVRLCLTYDDETGIGSLRLNGDSDTRVYELSGRQVNNKNLRNGIYIIDGKKYYNKNK